MTTPDQRPFHSGQALEGGEMVFAGGPEIAAYIYTIEEILALGQQAGLEHLPGGQLDEQLPKEWEWDPETIKKVETNIEGVMRIINALNFLYTHQRLTENRPPVAEISSAFEIMVEVGEEIVMFADPTSFPPPQRAGVQYSRERLTKFGRGNLDQAIARLKTYLESYYREHGTIAGAISSNKKNGVFEASFKELLTWEKEQKARAK